MGCCQTNGLNTNNPVQKQNSTFYNLTIKTFTWSRDSHGLFDYECKNLIKDSIKMEFNGILVRKKDQVKMQKIEGGLQSLDSFESLIGINYLNNEYKIEPMMAMDYKQYRLGISDYGAWTIIKSIKNENGVKGYKLKIGDYIKLGRVRFRIRDFQLSQSKGIQSYTTSGFKFNAHNDIMKLSDNIEKQEELGDNQSITESQTQNMCCRICLNESEGASNPLITPCKCSGTMKFIHVICLQKWLRNKLHPKQSANSISFIWKTFDCELCKMAFPNTVDVNGKQFDTMEIPRPESPFLTLEILSREKNIIKGIHIISFAKKNQIKLGRGHDSDIRITDISVSRYHAKLKVEKDEFYLEDNNSKFGTLVLMDYHTVLKPEINNNLAVQVGRTIMSFTLKKTWKILNVCFGPNPIQNQEQTQTNQNLELFSLAQQRDIQQLNDSQDDDGGLISVQDQDVSDEEEVIQQNQNEQQPEDNDEEEEDEEDDQSDQQEQQIEQDLNDNIENLDVQHILNQIQPPLQHQQTQVQMQNN